MCVPPFTYIPPNSVNLKNIACDVVNMEIMYYHTPKVTAINSNYAFAKGKLYSNKVNNVKY